MSKWSQLIKQRRLQLNESQTEFGKRFGVSHAAVSDWEGDKSEAPYAVTEWFVSFNNKEKFMGDSPTFNAVFIGQDGLKDSELGQRYLIQVDVDSPGRLFVDITNVVNRAGNGTLPHKGEYFVDQSGDWFEKHEAADHA